MGKKPVFDDDTGHVDFDPEVPTDANVPTGGKPSPKSGKVEWDLDTGHVDFDAEVPTDANVKNMNDPSDPVDPFEDRD